MRLLTMAMMMMVMMTVRGAMRDRSSSSSHRKEFRLSNSSSHSEEFRFYAFCLRIHTHTRVFHVNAIICTPLLNTCKHKQTQTATHTIA